MTLGVQAHYPGEKKAGIMILSHVTLNSKSCQLSHLHGVL